MRLKPRFKKGAKTDPRNYRPIPVLLLMSKVLERILHEQTVQFLEKRNILYKSLSGLLIKNHSIDFYLSYLTDKISNGVDSGLLTGMTLIDLQKSIRYYILLKMSSLRSYSHVKFLIGLSHTYPVGNSLLMFMTNSLPLPI